MFTDKQRDSLAHSDGFVAFLEEVYGIREAQIMQLYDKPVDAVQQVAGRILQCDEILKMGGWDKIQERRLSK